jgi:abortive infection bacteriophage resistance protein
MTVWPFFCLKKDHGMTELANDMDVKPFKEYDELLQVLRDRKMVIQDPLRAQRKLTQVGYYRLSGYWYTARKYKWLDDGKKEIHNEFHSNTKFEEVFDLYLFDKQLRLEISDAIERIEIFLRTIIAHEIGRISPLAYLDKKQFSKGAFDVDSKIPNYDEWLERHTKLLDETKEDCIIHYRKNSQPVPIWVACEVWDFGTMSRLFSMLSGKNQDLICKRIDIDSRKALENWLINLNGIRNRCAHHSRVFNKPSLRGLILPQKGYFNLLDLSRNEKDRLYGLITVMWFLLKKIGNNSKWIYRIADLVDNMPKVAGATIRSLGISADKFPREKFPELVNEIKESTQSTQPPEKPLIEILSDKIQCIQKSNLSELSEEQTQEYMDKLLECAELFDNC